MQKFKYSFILTTLFAIFQLLIILHLLRPRDPFVISRRITTDHASQRLETTEITEEPISEARKNRTNKTEEILPFSEECITMLAKITSNISAYLVDLDILRRLREDDCTSWNRNVLVQLATLAPNTPLSSFGRIIWITMRAGNDLNYLKFYSDYWRIIPRYEMYDFLSLKIPRNIRQFEEFWSRSRYIPCLGLKVERAENNRKIDPINGSRVLSDFVDELTNFDIYPMLSGGTFLGWYRECDVIPHTPDMDLQVPIEHYDHHLKTYLSSGNHAFILQRSLGLVQDGLEFTVRHKNESFSIDLFFIYDNGNESYVGGTDNEGVRFRYFYPKFDEICAGLLYERVFWVPCDPERYLEFEYGPNWKLDYRSDSYDWSESAANVRPNGQFKKEQLPKAIQYFRY